MYFYIFVVAVFLILYFFGEDLRHRYFAYFMNMMTKSKDPDYMKLKKDLFKPILSLKSLDNELKKKKALRILEVGVGTGANFEYYPDKTKLVVVDPNPHFQKYYDENRKQFANIDSEEIIVSTGEEMNMVESNSIDVVVMTLVMCSVSDTKKILKQIHRVLAPGGKFFYFEHIKEFSKDHGVRSMLQSALSSMRIWPFLFDGCYLDRDMLKDIQSTGFSQVDGKRVHAPTKSWLWIISPHLIGTATK